ncbi:hypothetical protein [Pseudomonas phage vB_Pae_BR233a]|nr:hypothetical protein [Pseudomonas phage vB_Pae_BR233a]
MFSIVADRPVDAALAAAEDISEAVQLIILRRTRAMDYAGFSLQSEELNTLALLGAMSGALLRACRAGVATQSGNPESVSRHAGGAA